MKDTVESRAVKIAAKIMNNADLCRYDTPLKCRKALIGDETCEGCIRSWLISKARSELKKEAAK